MCDILFQRSIYYASADFVHRRMTHRSLGVGGYGFGGPRACPWGSILRDQSGTALIIALVMVIVLSLIGLASIFTSTFEVKLSGNKRGSTNAFYTAESGIQAVRVFSGNFNSANSTNFQPAGSLPSCLQNESIDTRFSSPVIGINFADAPTVAIYHSTDTRCEPGTSATLENFDCERFIVNSTGRDQADISLSRSRSHVMEKLINHLPK